MSGELEFVEDSSSQMVFKSREVLGESVEPKMIKWLVDHGIVKNKKVASKALIVFSVVLIIVAIGVLTKGTFGVFEFKVKSQGDIKFYIPEIGRNITVPEGKEINKTIDQYIK